MKIISGIQQIGIGVPNAPEAFGWYRKHFGMDIRIFEDVAEAKLMTRYTNNIVEKRHAVLAMNLESGGGFEIWQYESKKPVAPKQKILLGDHGIFLAKMKSRDVEAAYYSLKEKKVNIISPLQKTPEGKKVFFLKDPYGNIFQVVDGSGWFRKENKFTGGAYGCIIGVSDIEESMKLYADILGYDKIVYDETDVFEDFAHLPGGNEKVRRVLLKHSKGRLGAFSRLLGPSELELVQLIDKKGTRIYDQRCWGDLGYIHICFDIIGMDKLRKECREKGFAFTVDSSNSFDMGDAAGHFSYIEDPDGTLIEFVETHRIPVLKKLGWYINLQKRKLEKPLPNWIVRSLGFNRVKA